MALAAASPLPADALLDKKLRTSALEVYPVQVDYFFWLDNFLHLCAQERYVEAKQSLETGPTFVADGVANAAAAAALAEMEAEWEAQALLAVTADQTCPLHKSAESVQEACAPQASGARSTCSANLAAPMVCAVPADTQQLQHGDNAGMRDVEIQEAAHEECGGEMGRRKRCLATFAGALLEYLRQLKVIAATEMVQPAQLTVDSSPSFELCELPGKGRTLVAARTIEIGELIAVEPPLLTFPRDDGTAVQPMVCAECHRTIGTLASQWERLPCGDRAPLPSADILDAADQRLRSVATASSASDTGACGCPCPNGPECSLVFCSSSCAAQSLRGEHGLLCMAALAPAQAEDYRAIMKIAADCLNPTLLLSVHLTAKMLMAIGRSASRDAEAMVQVIQDHVGEFHSACWEGLAEDTEIKESRSRIIQRISAHAQGVLGHLCADFCEPDLATELLLTPAAFSRCIGMLELVCIKGSVASPYKALFDHSRKSQSNPETSATASAADANQAMIDFASTSTARMLARPVQLNCLVPFIAHCNHSCIPNVEVDFRHDADLGAGLWCFVNATRSISRGEELTIQYLPVVSLPVAERRDQLLRGWHFECDCVRCVAEGRLSEDDAAWFSAGCLSFGDDSEDESDP